MSGGLPRCEVATPEDILSAHNVTGWQSLTHRTCPLCGAFNVAECSCTASKLVVWAQSQQAGTPSNALACDCTFGLAQDSQGRKDQPMCTGLLDYFPDALAEVSELSRMANEKHNPGEPLHWSRGKSNDHADCIVRHLLERGDFVEGEYPKAVRHSVALAWRALALAQVEIEAARADGKVSRGSR